MTASVVLGIPTEVLTLDCQCAPWHSQGVLALTAGVVLGILTGVLALTASVVIGIPTEVLTLDYQCGHRYSHRGTDP